MRAFRTAANLALLFAVACSSTDGMLDDDKDLQWGPPIEDDFDEVVYRARSFLIREYPLGIDPDRSKEDAGDFWSIWRYDISVMYRETKRTRGRVKVENLGAGKVRVGVAIMEQLNDNIDDPSDIDKAKWVRKHRLPERETLLREQIERTFSRFEASTTWKEKHRAKKRTTLRPDLVDRTSDIVLEDYKSSTISEQPKITGKQDGDKATDYGSHMRKKKPPPEDD